MKCQHSCCLDLREKAVSDLIATREAWLNTQELPDNSFAAWVDSVFNVAIKSIRELK
jgi:hypothetical protein